PYAPWVATWEGAADGCSSCFPNKDMDPPLCNGLDGHASSDSNVVTTHSFIGASVEPTHARCHARPPKVPAVAVLAGLMNRWRMERQVAPSCTVSLTGGRCGGDRRPSRRSTSRWRWEDPGRVSARLD